MNAFAHIKADAAPSIDSRFSAPEIHYALIDLASRGGPTEAEYPLCRKLTDSISALRADGTISEADNDALWTIVGEASTPATLMGHIYSKPLGYHGDFEIIDKFYTHWTSPSSHLTKWDRWIQSLEATQAVRNRKEFFKGLIAQLPRDRRHRVLSVGSGPCREITEALSEDGPHFDAVCLDLDAKAIEHARSLLNGQARDVTFVHGNALRLAFKEEFDLTWSAGLFDYLDDRLFVGVLRRLFRATLPGGRVVIGNFSSDNPSRSAMEWGNWRLHHRSSSSLRQLVNDAGLDARAVEIEAEPLGVNLFVTVFKG